MLWFPDKNTMLSVGEILTASGTIKTYRKYLREDSKAAAQCIKRVTGVYQGIDKAMNC